jgi:hypothetical protein
VSRREVIRLLIKKWVLIKQLVQAALFNDPNFKFSLLQKLILILQV